MYDKPFSPTGNAFNEGRQAFKDGIPCFMNPYKVHEWQEPASEAKLNETNWELGWEEEQDRASPSLF